VHAPQVIVAPIHGTGDLIVAIDLNTITLAGILVAGTTIFTTLTERTLQLEIRATTKLFPRLEVAEIVGAVISIIAFAVVCGETHNAIRVITILFQLRVLGWRVETPISRQAQIIGTNLVVETIQLWINTDQIFLVTVLLGADVFILAIIITQANAVGILQVEFVSASRLLVAAIDGTRIPVFALTSTYFVFVHADIDIGGLRFTVRPII